MFFRVSVPIAWPAILSGLLLAWLRAFGEFGATVMVAYHPYSLPVYTYVAFGSQGLAGNAAGSAAGARARACDHAAERSCRARVRERRRSTALAPEDLPSMAHLNLPRLSAVKTGATDLALEIERQLGSFHLDVRWSPQRPPARHSRSVGFGKIADAEDHRRYRSLRSRALSRSTAGISRRSNLRRAASPMCRRTMGCFRI